MKRVHPMPFGAEVLAEGVRFRLWAPAAQEVHLALAHASLPMSRLDDGWFELVTSQASAGSFYQFDIDRKLKVPDPASRFQPEDVHGPSEVIDPAAFTWGDENWTGRPWEEAVIYELHVGTFTPEGTFAGVERKLDYLADLGVTAIELMPVSDFPGMRNWGYDGVLPYAPDSSYGKPEDLKRLVQQAHARGLMMLLDVVYNHFGPEGNYLSSYSPEFFTSRHCTPWGDAINFDGSGSRTVRDYFIHNALYWLEEYHFDGLRFDAVHAIVDDSKPDILAELAETIRCKLGAARHIHLVLENEQNAAHYLRRNERFCPKLYNAQWNDDVHHCFHVLLTGETDGYYSDYSRQPLRQLGRCLAEGFAYQGDVSAYRGGERRGEPSRDLPPSAFISFLQNHDQIGNRAFGERILRLADCGALRMATAILLLAPAPPLLFMGEEFAAEARFLFFCDFKGDLAAAVTNGRRSEFQRFAKFSDPALRAQIPDPNAKQTFESSKLNWKEPDDPRHQDWLRLYHELLAIRQNKIVPLLREKGKVCAEYKLLDNQTLFVQWEFAKRQKLGLLANFSEARVAAVRPPGELIYATAKIATSDVADMRELPPMSAAWFLES
jgi:maltooligosyltrehalose trehalohydrolase